MYVSTLRACGLAILIAGALVFPTPAFSQYAPKSLNISGALYLPTGLPVTSSSVDFRIEIWDKNATCKLYEESHLGQNLSQTKGGFSLQLGQGSAISNYRDAGNATSLSWLVFANPGGAATVFAGCGAGVVFAAGDNRLIRVYYNLGSGMTAMTPDVPIESSAYAMVADTLEGKKAAEFIQVLDDVGTDLTQSNVQTVFSATNYAKLLQLLNNTFSGSYGFNNQRITDVAAPTAGTDAVNRTWVDGHVADKAADLSGVGAGTNNGHTLIWDAGNNRWTTGVPSAIDNSKLPLAGGTMSGPITMGGYDLYNTGHITMGNQRMLTLGRYTNAQEGALGLGVGDEGRMFYNTEMDAVRVWDGTGYIGFGASGVAGGDLTGSYPNPTIKVGAVTTTKIANDAVQSAHIDNAGIGMNRLVISDGVSGNALRFKTCALNQILRWEATGWQCVDPGSALPNTGIAAGMYGSSTTVPRIGLSATGVVTSATDVAINFPVISVNGKTGVVVLNGADLGLGTASLEDVGNGANEVPMTDGAGKLNPSVIPTLSIGDISGAITQIVAGAGLTGGGTQGVVTLAVDLTQVDAYKLRGRDLSSVAPNDNEVLMWNALTNTWLARPIPSAPVTTVAGRTGNVVLSEADISGAVTEIVATGPLTGGGTTGVITLGLDASQVDAARIRGVNISTTTPTLNQVLQYNGSGWEAATLADNGIVTMIGNNGALVSGPATVKTISIDTGVTTGQIVQVAAGDRLPVIDGSNLTQISNLRGVNVSTTTPTLNQVLKYNGSGWEAALDANSGGTVTLVAMGSGMAPGNITATGTISVDVGTGANQIVQLDGSARLPAVNGSQLTNVNAVQIQARDIAAAAPADNQVLTWNNGASRWEPRSPGAGADDLGSHIAAQNIRLNGFWLSGDGGNEGVFIPAAGNVGVGTNTPNANAILDVNGVGTMSAMLVPRDTAGNRPTGVEGMIRYNTSTAKMEVYESGQWSDVVQAPDGGITTLTGTNGALVSGTATVKTVSIDTGVTAGQIVQVAAGDRLPAIDGRNLTQISNLRNVNVSTTTPTLNQVLQYNGSAWEATTLVDNAGVTYVGTTTDLTGGPINGTGTLGVNTGTGANQILKLNGSSQIPAVDGSLLTFVNAANIRGVNVSTTAPTSGQVMRYNGSAWEAFTLTDNAGVTLITAGSGLLGGTVTATGTVSVDVGTGANQIVQLDGSARLPAVNGSLLTNVNAVALQTYAVHTSAPADNQVLTWNATATRWEARSPGAGADNLGTHIAAQNIQLNGFWLSGDGGSEGIFIPAAGNVGVGTNTPNANAILDVNGVGAMSAMIVPRDTQANRPAGVNGMIRYNTNTAKMEVFENGGWTDVVQVADGVGVSYVATTTDLTGGPISSTGTLGINTGTGANQILKLNGSSQIPAVDGSLLTDVNAASIRGVNVATTAPSSGQVLKYNGSGWAPAADDSFAVAAGTGILLSGPATLKTISVDVGIGANQIPQLNASGFLGIGTASVTAGAVADFYGATSSDSAVVMPRATSANRPSGVNGMIRYNTSLAKFEVYENGGWYNMATGSTGDNLGNHLATQQILATLGTANAPGYSFNGDPDTGMWNAGGNVLAFSTGGTERLRIAADGYTTIKKDSVSFELQGTEPQMYFNQTAPFNDQWWIGAGVYGNPGFGIADGMQTYMRFRGNNVGITDDTPDFRLEVAGDMAVSSTEAGNGDRFLVTNNGRVGISTDSPNTAAVLDVNGTGNLSAMIVPRATTAERPVSAANGMIRYNTNISRFEVYEGGNWVNMTAVGAGTGDFKADGSVPMTGTFRLNGQWLSNDGGAEGIRVSNTGLVGVGTATPGAALHVNAPSSQWTTALWDRAIIAQGASDTAIQIGHGSGNRFGIGNNGNFSVFKSTADDTTSPSDYSFYIDGTTGNLTLGAYGSGASLVSVPGEISVGSGYLTNLAPSNGAIIEGQVGIGTNAPTTGAMLDVNGLGSSSSIRVPRDTTANRPTGANGMIRYNTNTSKFEVYIAGNWADMATGSGTASQWTTVAGNEIHYSTANVGIGTNDPNAPLEIASNGDSNQLILNDTNGAFADDLYLRNDGVRLYVGNATDGQTSLVLDHENDRMYLGDYIGTLNPIKLEITSDSGTDDLFALSSTTSVIGDRFIAKNSGHIGIGTTNPSTLFSVAGTAGTSADFFFDNADVGDSNDGQRLNVHRRAAEGDARISLLVDQYRQGIVDTDSNLFLRTNEAFSSIYLMPVQELVMMAGGVNRMTIKENGLIGVGTDTPVTGAIMELKGTGVNYSSLLVPRDTTANRPTSAQNGMIRYNTNTSKFEVYVAGGWADVATGSATSSQWTTVAGNEIHYSTANVGIGTNNPSTTLDVRGNFSVDNGAFTAFSVADGSSRIFGFADDYEFYGNGNNVLQMEFGAAENMRLQTDVGYALLLQHNGNGKVAIGTTSAANQSMFEVRGTGNLSNMMVPRGTTAERAATPANGMIRYNTNTTKFEVYAGSWQDLAMGSAAGATDLDGLSDAIYDAPEFSLYLGTLSGVSASTGGNNTALGYRALNAVTTGGDNTAVGYRSLDNISNGTDNTAVGTNSLRTGSAATGNTAIGTSALYDATGNRNTGIGRSSLVNLSTGTDNTALGYYAGFGVDAVTAGSANVMIGSYSGEAVTTADNNILIGYAAGNNITSGDNNLLIGHDIDAASATSSFQMSIGNMIFGLGINGTGTTISNGRIGIASNAPQAVLDVVGTGTASALIVPRDTTAARSGVGVNGMIRYNTNTSKFEVYVAGNWADMATGSGGGSQWTTVAGNEIHYSTANVGIGTNNPGSLLHVFNGDIELEDTYSIVTGGSQLIGGSGNVAQIAFGPWNNWMIGHSDTSQSGTISTSGSYGAINFHVELNGAERLRVDDAGRVGVNTTSPTTGAIMDLNGTGNLSSLVLPRGSTAQRAATPVNGMVRYNFNTNKIEGYENGGWANLNGVASVAGKTGTVTINLDDLTDAETNGSNSIYLGMTGAAPGSSESVYLGVGAGAANAGSQNVVLGNQALEEAGGDQNVTIGYRAGRDVTGDNNVIIGHQAGDALNGGGSNILIGVSAQAPAAGSNSRLNIGNTIFGDLANDRIKIGVNDTLTAGVALEIATSGTAGSSVLFPRDSTANRPTTGVNGMMRYNTNLAAFEVYAAGSWQSLTMGSGSSSQWSTVGGGIHYSSGNVAIGTNDPVRKFMVRETNTQTASGYYATSDSQVDVAPGSASSAIAYYAGFNRLSTSSSNLGSADLYGVNNDIHVYNGTGAIGNAYGMMNNVSNFAGRTITNATGNFSTVTSNHASSTIGNGTGVFAAVSNTAGTISNARGVHVGTIQGTNKWSLYAEDATAPSYFAGNVGIGTNNPGATLHVQNATSSASISVEAQAAATAAVFVANGVAGGAKGLVIQSGGNNRWQFSADNVAESGSNVGSDLRLQRFNDAGTLIDVPLFIQRSSGYVGIGTTSPSLPLHAHASAAANGVAIVRNTDTGTTSEGLHIRLDRATPTNTNLFAAFKNNAGTTIGSISGDGAGGVQYNLASDRRLKSDIRDTRYGIADLMKIRVRDYQYTGHGVDTNGFIAQELYEAYPHAVSKPEDEAKSWWQVDYGRLTPLIVKGVQDTYGLCKMTEEQTLRLQVRVEAHEAEIQSLKREVQSLREKNQELEQKLDKVLRHLNLE